MLGTRLKPRSVSTTLINGFTWWLKFSGIRIHHAIAFVSIQATSWVVIDSRVELSEVNAEYFREAQFTALEHFFIGGYIAIFSAFMIISAAALLDARLQIPLAIGVLAALEFLPSGIPVRATGVVFLPEAQDGASLISIAGRTGLTVAVFVSLILILWAAIIRVARRIDRWFDSKVEVFSESPVPPNQSATYSIFAVLSLLLAFFLPLFGIILGYVALNDIALSAGSKRGKDLAIAGIILGMIAIVIAGLLLLVWILGTFFLVGPFVSGF